MLYNWSARSTAVRYFKRLASKTMKVLRCLIRLASLHLPFSTSRGPKLRKRLSPSPPPTSTHTFYQAASGLPIFLHPLDVIILYSHFGVDAALPDTILVCVEVASDGFVDADLDHLRKYFSHTPEGAGGAFVEVDLEGGVGTEELYVFEGAIEACRVHK